MRKLFLGIFLTLSVLAKAQISIYTIVASGINQVVPTTFCTGTLFLQASGGSVTLTNPVAFSTAANLADGTTFDLQIAGGEFTLNGQTFTVFGYPVSQYQLTAGWKYHFVAHNNGALSVYTSQPADFSLTDQFNGTAVNPGTLPLAQLVEAMNPGDIIVGGASSGLAPWIDVTPSGAITVSDAGVFGIASGVITNTNISASAGIVLSKLATQTDNYVLAVNGSGVPVAQQYTLPLQGGTGINTSLSNGFPLISSGTWSVGTINEAENQTISFITAGQGTYYFYFPYACTVTGIQVNVTSTIAGTDSGQLTFQNAASTALQGSNLSAGQMKVAESASVGWGWGSTVTAYGAVAAGSYIQVTSLKTTSGGLVNVSLFVTRLN